MSNGLRAYLDHSNQQACQRPFGSEFWEDQCAEEVGQIVGQRMKLKSDLVGLEWPQRIGGVSRLRPNRLMSAKA